MFLNRVRIFGFMIVYKQFVSITSISEYYNCLFSKEINANLGEIHNYQNIAKHTKRYNEVKLSIRRILMSAQCNGGAVQWPACCF